VSALSHDDEPDIGPQGSRGRASAATPAAARRADQTDATGLPHPRGYGNFPRVIARYVRERNVLTLPEAIRKMTSWPATRMRLGDRGLIRDGLCRRRRPITARFGTAPLQPTQYPDGIEWVLVNGEVVIVNRHLASNREKCVADAASQLQTEIQPISAARSTSRSRRCRRRSERRAELV
jgi:hypothetical protein